MPSIPLALLTCLSLTPWPQDTEQAPQAWLTQSGVTMMTEVLSPASPPDTWYTPLEAAWCLEAEEGAME